MRPIFPWKGKGKRGNKAFRKGSSKKKKRAQQNLRPSAGRRWPMKILNDREKKSKIWTPLNEIIRKPHAAPSPLKKPP